MQVEVVDPGLQLQLAGRRGLLGGPEASVWEDFDPTGDNANLSPDPEYIDVSSTDPAGWDLHLAPSSPLVDPD